MAKAILTIGYTDYVMDLKDAVTVAEIMSRAERHEEKYVSNAENTVHIYELDGTSSNARTSATIRLITDAFYRMAKMAGPPPTK